MTFLNFFAISGNVAQKPRQFMGKAPERLSVTSGHSWMGRKAACERFVTARGRLPPSERE